MARTKQTAQKDTGGKPLAMGRGRGKAYPEEELHTRRESGQEGGAGVLFRQDSRGGCPTTGGGS